MIVRPTIYPERVQFHLAVFGERGRMLLKMSVSYSATMDGELRQVEDILTPSRIPRQRRHLWGGTMVMADVRGERKVVDFMSTFHGEWLSDMMVLHRRDEISFLVDGVRKLRSAGVVVTLDGDFGDIMSDKSMRLSMDLSIKSEGVGVFAKPLVGDQDVDLVSLEDAVRKGKQWVVSDGKVVRVEDGVDLGLVLSSSNKYHFVPWSERSRVHGTMRLIRDSKIADGMAPVLKRALTNEDKDQVPKSVRATLRDYQIEGKNWLVKMISSGSGGILADAMGLGKMSATYTPVLTPQGWRKIGELKVGDQVYGSDGLPHSVIGVYPQGKKQLYRVTFSDGSSTNCGAEHLWSVRKHVYFEQSEEMVVPLQRIIDDGWNNRGHLQWSIPVCYPIRFDHKDFEVEPSIFGGMKDASEYGYDESFPPEYMFGSMEQRRDLLDSFIKSKSNGAELTSGLHIVKSTSKALISDIVRLAWSLGIMARVTRHSASFYAHIDKGHVLGRRYFQDIEPMGEEEAVCIAVDAPDRLYVTEDYILTHNTIQAITAFMEMRESDPKYRAIVFVPTSLTVNWQREFEKFAPSVSVLIWEGANRKKKTELLAKCDVTIVPYSVYMRDYDLINRFPYNVAYYDEAQWMKNPDTATHKAAIRCLAPTRIAMTGTPVENHLRDLHSIMAIACPGLLPPAKEFDEKIARPYKNGDSRAVKIMAEQIRPFTLRRTQEQVLGEMPEKTIIDHVCPMTDKQAEYYEAVREQSARDRDSAISDGNKSALNALYLKLLTRLRRTATDPRLADPLGDFRAEDSGKMLALKAIMSGIEEDETNKCLIFSQWTDCLDLIRQDLEQRGEKFCYLTGETKDRQGEVDRFQDEKGGIRYFLMSLKAGGVGLNITAANFVVIMDPWWNPAIESQATARAHRFGQKRAVTVYRLIAQDTLEEKIAMRKDLKQALADGIVDDKAIPTMSVDEMGGLLD